MKDLVAVYPNLDTHALNARHKITMRSEHEHDVLILKTSFDLSLMFKK